MLAESLVKNIKFFSQDFLSKHEDLQISKILQSFSFCAGMFTTKNSHIPVISNRAETNPSS